MLKLYSLGEALHSRGTVPIYVVAGGDVMKEPGPPEPRCEIHPITEIEVCRWGNWEAALFRSVAD